MYGRWLDLAEAGSALAELNVCTTKEDVAILFKFLDEDRSGYLVCSC